MSAFGFGAFAGGMAKREMEKRDAADERSQEKFLLDVKAHTALTEGYQKNRAARTAKTLMAREVMKATTFTAEQVLQGGNSTDWDTAAKIQKYLKDKWEEPGSRAGQRANASTEELFGPAADAPQEPVFRKQRSGGLSDVFSSFPDTPAPTPPDPTQGVPQGGPQAAPAVPQGLPQGLPQGSPQDLPQGSPQGNLGDGTGALRRSVERADVTAFASEARQGIFKEMRDSLGGSLADKAEYNFGMVKAQGLFRNIATNAFQDGANTNEAMSFANEVLSPIHELSYFRIATGRAKQEDWARDISPVSGRSATDEVNAAKDIEIATGILSRVVDNETLFRETERILKSYMPSVTGAAAVAADNAIRQANQTFIHEGAERVRSMKVSPAHGRQLFNQAIAALPRHRREDMQKQLTEMAQAQRGEKPATFSASTSPENIRDEKRRLLKKLDPTAIQKLPFLVDEDTGEVVDQRELEARDVSRAMDQLGGVTPASDFIEEEELGGLPVTKDSIPRDPRAGFAGNDSQFLSKLGQFSRGEIPFIREGSSEEFFSPFKEITDVAKQLGEDISNISVDELWDRASIAIGDATASVHDVAAPVLANAVRGIESFVDATAKPFFDVVAETAGVVGETIETATAKENITRDILGGKEGILQRYPSGLGLILKELPSSLRAKEVIEPTHEDFMEAFRMAKEDDATLASGITNPFDTSVQDAAFERTILRRKFLEDLSEGEEGIQERLLSPISLKGAFDEDGGLDAAARDKLTKLIQDEGPNQMKKIAKGILDDGSEEVAKTINSFSPEGKIVTAALFTVAGKRKRSFTKALRDSVTASLRADPDESTNLEYTSLNEGGFIGKKFKDSQGHATIGIGFNLDRAGAKESLAGVVGETAADDILAGRRDLTQKEATSLFNKDMAVSETEVKSVVKDFGKLPKRVKKVLIDMHFNMGLVKLKTFKKFLKAVEDRNWEGAMEEMLDSNYAFQVGARAINNAKLLAREAGEGTDTKKAGLE